ncbi:MAG: hypothetical protein DRJ10_01305 [Bacteroidetes bacterium]|nr:MAG: hypothetical protein DRJ10_01305 [Bacteroidota bacterium]
MIDFNSIEDLKRNGFKGFKKVNDLWNNRSDIPKEKGVYLVLDPNFNKPEYIIPGVGGFFKNRNPNVPNAELERNFVPNSLVVYIGKAGSLTGNATLHSRLGQYLRFGQGKKVGHWGGRYIWQLKKYQELIFCWKPTPGVEPRNVEVSIMNNYSDQFYMRPFANLVA